MRVGLATDHGGFDLKQEICRRGSRAAGHEVVDFGAYALDPADDYPDFVVPLARAVAAGQVERGIAICGSGVGAAVCANKLPGVRAALIHDHFSARQGVEDDHMNVLCMGGRTLGPAVAWDFVETFLAAEFSQAERHLRRLAKVAALESPGSERLVTDLVRPDSRGNRGLDRPGSRADGCPCELTRAMARHATGYEPRLQP